MDGPAPSLAWKGRDHTQVPGPKSPSAAADSGVGCGGSGLVWGTNCDEFGWALLSGMAVVPQGTGWPFVQSQLLGLGCGSLPQHPPG